MSSPILWGPNNTSTHLQEKILLSNGQLLSNNGPKNYIKNNTFDSPTFINWNEFTTTLTNKIPTGSITLSAANLNYSVDTNSTIAGVNSLTFNVSSSSGLSGQGVISDAFTIDKEDQSKVLAFKFSYKLSGSNYNVSGTSNNSLAIYIYDVTNSAWIQPAGVYNFTQNTGIGTATGTFQTTSNSTQYRLAILFINDSPVAGFPSYFSSFFVGPQVTSIGPAMSDWKSYTPTLSGLSLGNGTARFFYRIEADSIAIKGSIGIGSTTTFSSNFGITIPSGLSIDSSKLEGPNGAGGNFGRFGVVYANDASTSTFYAGVIYNSSSTVLNFLGSTANFTSTSPFTWTTSDEIHVPPTNLIPISGFSSNTVQSADTDTRVNAISLSNVGGSTTTIGTSNTKIAVLTSIVTDKSGMYDSANNRIRINVSGEYKVSARIRLESLAASRAVNLQVYKNNSSLSEIAEFKNTDAATAFTGTISGDIIVSLNSGDYLELYARVDSGTTAVGSYTLSAFNVERLSGPAIVQATETVAVEVNTTAGQSIPNTSSTQITFGTVESDTHGAWSTNTFTAPVSGRYLVAVNINYSTNNTGYRVLDINANGVTVFRAINQTVGTSDFSMVGSKVVRLLAGQTIRIFTEQSSGGNLSLTTNAGRNTLSIVRVGN